MSRLKKIPMLDMDSEIVVPDVLVEGIRDLSSRDIRLRGIEFPTITSEIDDYTKERWVQAVEIMMSRGIQTAREIAGFTDLSVKYAGMFKNEVLKRWGGTMTAGTANARREKLYYEAERVKAELWRMYEQGMHTGADAREQLAYLKMVVDTGSRQAKLCGLEGQAPVEAPQQNKTKEQMANEVIAQIPVDKLEEIGRLIASEIGKDSGKDGH